MVYEEPTLDRQRCRVIDNSGGILRCTRVVSGVSGCDGVDREEGTSGVETQDGDAHLR